MKIIGGKYRRRNFYMPQGIRPTQNIARKAVFDLLGQDLSGLTFLDLFAGSGAVGLEAVSRGASGVTFVEKEPRFAEIIRKNADLLEVPLGQRRDSFERPSRLGQTGSQERPHFPCTLINTDAFAAVKVLAREGRKFHIVFADPPYGLGLAKKILKTLGAYDIVVPTSTVILQHERQEILPVAEGRLLFLRKKQYGNTSFSIYGC